LLRKDGIGTVFFGEEELAKGMTSHVLERFAPQQVTTTPGHG
jgi:CPA2 family monovalent cation:H+ antiporter-2